MIPILHVVTDMNRGGLETMIMNYYRNIDRTAMQFDFLVHRQQKAQYDDEIEQLGGKIYHLPRLNPFSPSYHRALSDFFDKHSEYQIIHVHQDCLSAVILKEARKHGIPVRIAHSHSSSQDKNIKYLIKLWYKQFIPKYATYLFACGKEAGDWMFGGAEFRILNNAIDAQKYSYQEEIRRNMRNLLKIPEDTLLIGHVGRFSSVKNHLFMIDIFQKILNKTKAMLLFVGDGELRPSAEEKVSRLGIEKNVIFAGIQPNVSEYMQAMDIFLFPSVYEGLPLTLIEAQAAGLPCIISDSIPPECRKTNLVRQIPLSSSAEQWAEAVISAAKEPRRNTYEEIRKSGFDIKENADWLQNFYRSQLTGRETSAL